MNGGIHGLRNLEKLVVHERVAEYLRSDPERVPRVAGGNLDRWLSDDPESKPHFHEWRAILASRTVPELLALITADDEEGRRLRQSAPFAGVVAAEEREEAFAVARKRWESR
jgi:hypothetical protein